MLDRKPVGVKVFLKRFLNQIAQAPFASFCTRLASVKKVASVSSDWSAGEGSIDGFFGEDIFQFSFCSVSLKTEGYSLSLRFFIWS